MSDFPEHDVPKIQEPEAYEVLRKKAPILPPLYIEAWDDRLPIVWKKYRGMYPFEKGSFVEVQGKRKKKLKIRYAPTMTEHRGWNCDVSIHEWVFFGGEQQHEGKPVLVFYFVFYQWKICGAFNSPTAREYFQWTVYMDLVDLETGEVLHKIIR